MMQSSDQDLLHAVAHELEAEYVSSGMVHGGDINRAYQFNTSKGRFFIKVNDASEASAMFTAEADGLAALQRHFSGQVPQVVGQGRFERKAWLALQWLEKGNAPETALRALGGHMAAMHRVQQPFFGWHTDNYIGSIIQQNKASETWPDFYVQYRLLPLVKKLVDTGRWGKKETSQANTFFQKLPSLLPEEPAALLHGDLWNGNFMITSDDRPAIFDPAVYFGHREMDIAMTKLFGGFGQAFYESYQNVYPLQSGWQLRLPVMQLYPLLVHAVLFGGHYVPASGNILHNYA